MERYIFYLIFILFLSYYINQWQVSLPSNKKKYDASNFDIESVLKNREEVKIIIAISDYINNISNYGENLGKLTKPQKYFLFIDDLEGEVNNGGFNQYYFNSSGANSLEVIDALNAIGAFKTSLIVKKANEQFPGGVAPKDRKKRITLESEIEDKANPVWEKCDEDFFKYEDNIDELLIKYVKEHKSEFRKR